MGRYIKLNGQNIIGHIDSKHPDINTEDYDVLVEEDILINENGDIKYKYLDEKLVELDQSEIDVLPTIIEKKAESKFNKVISLITLTLALEKFIDHPATPQKMKDRAQNRLTKINQQIADELGL